MNSIEIRPFLESITAGSKLDEDELQEYAKPDAADALRHIYQKRARQHLLAHDAIYATFQGAEQIKKIKPVLGSLALRSGFGNYGPMTEGETDKWVDTISAHPDPRVTMFLDGESEPMAAQTTCDPSLDQLDARTRKEVTDCGPYDFITYCNGVMVDPDHRRQGLAVVLRMLLLRRVKDTLKVTNGQRGCIVSKIVEQKDSEGPAHLTGARPVGSVFFSTNGDIPRSVRLMTNYRLWICDVESEI